MARLKKNGFSVQPLQSYDLNLRQCITELDRREKILFDRFAEDLLCQTLTSVLKLVDASDSNLRRQWVVKPPY